MTRYYYGQGKDSVEDYPKTIGIKFLKEYGYLDAGVYHKSGSLRWIRNGVENGNISVEVSRGDTEGYVRVCFTQTQYDGEKNSLDYKIQLVSTPCNYGGVRWWLLCPCKLNRCSILYLQSNGIFASRKTLNLCYSEQKESKRMRHLGYILGRPFNKLYMIQSTIKYPYRNGKPTRKMRRFLKLHHQMPSEAEIENIGTLLGQN